MRGKQSGWLAIVRQQAWRWLQMDRLCSRGRSRFVFRPVTFGGSGLSEEFRAARWPAFRRSIHQGRGT